MDKQHYIALLAAFLLCVTALLFFFISERKELPSAAQPSDLYDIQVILKAKANPPDFWRIVEQGIVVAAAEFGARCEVSGPKEEQDIDGQIALVEQAIAKNPDAIILAAADYERLVPVCEQAKKAGIRVVTVDSDVNFPDKKCFVGTDNYELGRKLAEQVDMLIGSDERFGVIGHMSTVTTGMERERGLLEHVYNAQERLAGIEYCESSEELARLRTIKMLEDYPEIKCMVGLNESSALGVARGVRELGLAGKVKIVACDSSQEQIELMEDGTIQAFVVQHPFNMGYMSVKTTVELLQGKAVEEIVSTESVVVTKDNMYQKENQKLLFPFSNTE